MEIVKPKVEFIPQGEGLEGIYKQIEIAGRTCYKSPMSTNPKSFVNRMISNSHLAMLEHGTVYLKVPKRCISFYESNPHSVVNGQYVTTNLRVLYEHNHRGDLKYICEPTDKHEKRFTFRFTTQVAISREANRHRLFSVAEQSTRYCNFSKKRFGSHISISQPIEIFDMSKYSHYSLLKLIACKIIYPNFCIFPYLIACRVSEMMYFAMLKIGLKPETARGILPIGLNTEVVYTAFEKDWKHFLSLRWYGDTGRPHPDIKNLAGEVKRLLKK